jgi:anti-sigma factor RsiW
MDHEKIDEGQIAERYVLGQLDPEERQLFEEHFLDCAECLEKVELAEQLRHGLQRAAARRAAAVVAGGSLLAVLARLRRWQRIALAAAALVIAAGLPLGLLLGRVSHLDRELQAARKTLAGRPAEPPRPPSGVSLPAVEISRLESEVAARQQEVARLEGELEKARRPQVNVPILALSLVRSAAGEEVPVPQLRVPPEAPWIVVSLEPSDPGFPAYRATLQGSGRQSVWQGGGLTLSPAGLLSFSLPRPLLAPGTFRLRIEGLPPGRPPVPAGEFPFRVTM